MTLRVYIKEYFDLRVILVLVTLRLGNCQMVQAQRERVLAPHYC
jgi:hypothetical protein